jgi:hydrophobic/amphiphilic exporter-1 (mainly G- bacteria), HAE1 family
MPTSPTSSHEEENTVASKLAFVATRPVAIMMFILALVVFGVVSLGKLPVDLLPEISYPTLTVRTAYPGAAPEDVEDRVSERLQESLSTLKGLVRSTSVSRAGFSDVLLEFDWGTNMTFAVQEVRDRLDGVFLPQAAERPLILRYDPNLDPILRVGVRPATGDEEEDDLIRLRWIAEKRIKRELEGIPGVAAVQVRGGLQEEIRVRVDPYKLAAQGLDPDVIATRLQQENLNASGGQIREGSTDYLVRTLNEFETVGEIEHLAIVQRGDAVIRLRDVASVTRTHAEREVVTRLDGAQAVEIAIFREAGANIVDVAEIVKNSIFGTERQREKAAEKSSGGKLSVQDRSEVNFLAWHLREDVKLETLSDQSIFIAAAVDEVKNSAVVGALLAVLVMWFFLRKLSATAIIAAAIPISVCVTFAPMFLMGVSLNIMSLGGLALGVGMLVDNAIVVLESITRCREEGDSLAGAAVRGVSEVSGAIIASTLTTVAVFAPIVFVHGIAGQIFGDQAVTVVSSLLVSLLVAVLFIPMLASRSFLSGGGLDPVALYWMVFNALSSKKKSNKESSFGDSLSPDEDPPSARAWRFLCKFFRDFYPPEERWGFYEFIPNMLRFGGRSAVLLGFLFLRLVGIVLVATYGLILFFSYPLRWAFNWAWGILDRTYPVVLRQALAHPLIVLLAIGGVSWLGYQRVGRLGLELLPEIHQGEFTAHIALGVGSPLENSDAIFRELDREIRRLDGVEITALTVGVEEDTLTREIEGEHTARMTVKLTPEASTPEREEQVLEAVRSVLRGQAEVRSIDISRPTPFALESPLAVEVRGHDLERMTEVALEVRDKMEAIEGLTDIRMSVRPGHPEARISFDRDKTLEFGLDIATISNLVRDQVLGKVSTRFVDGEDRIDIRVQADEEILASLADVLALTVNPAAENSVPLSAVASIDVVRGPAEIRRIGSNRAVVVTAASTGLDLGGLTESIEAAIGTILAPDEVIVELGGQKREMEEGINSLKFALLLAIFLVYVVMASQFESLIQPLIILFSVPLAALGVVFVLDALSIPLSVVVFIGMILLAGIVVNNAIVLLDRINAKRREGLTPYDAVLDAGRARLRPIMMTTATTVLGLLPLTGWLMAGEGVELRAPMAITVIAGLVSSTILTLIVIPVIYHLLSFREARKSEA